MKFFPLLLAFAFVTPAAFSSGISTSGGVPTVDQENAWFLGDDPVQYCVQAGGAFNKAAASALVRDSIDDWRAFFRKYGLDAMKFTGLGGGRNLGLALRFEEVPSCSKPKEQIRFLFGVTTPEIEQALVLQREAFGLSYRDNYDHDTYRTGGQVFVRDLPYDGNKLKHILLHELGHVFGMEHDSVYVMDANVADLVRGTIPTYSGFGVIESETWPYRLLDGQTVELSANGRKEGKFEPNFVIPFLRDLFGFPHDGFHSAKLHFAYKPGPINYWHATFEFQDYASGAVKQLEGDLRIPDLKSNFKGLRGPSLYTNWACSSCNDGAMMYRKHLDGQPSGMEADGSLHFGATVLPAILEQRKGLYLRAFVPSANTWWSTENYISSYFAR